MPVTTRTPIEPLLRTFTEVARLSSFSQAARSLGLSRAAVSAQVAQLEAHLGAALLARTTRSVRLTDEGEQLLARGGDVLAQLDALTHQFQRAAGEVAGPLRVEAPEFIGTKLLAQPLVAWLQAHPAVNLTLRLNDRMQAVDGFDADVMLRFELPQAHRLRYRVLARWQLINVAAPSYIAQHGVPRSLARMHKHGVIDYLNEATGRPFAWEYPPKGRVGSVQPTSRLCCNNTDAAVQAALSGLGLYRDFRFVLAPHLASGALQEVLPLQRSPAHTLYALWKPGRPVAPRVLAFVEFLTEVIRPSSDEPL